MRKKIIKLLLIAICFQSFIYLNVDKVDAANYQQDKIVKIAMKEKGKKYQRKYGASPWCAAFVNWSARQAGVSTSVIPATYSSTDMYNKVLKLGGKKVSSPKKGDLVFYKKSSKSSSMRHVAIMTSSSMSIHGNYQKMVSYIKAKDYMIGKKKISKSLIVYVRPKYPTVPAIPVISSAQYINETIAIKWSKVSNVSSYELLIKDKSGKVVKTTSISSSKTAYSFTYSEPGQYSIYLRAKNSIGYSSYSKKNTLVIEESIEEEFENSTLENN